MPHVIGKTFVVGAMVACLAALLPHSTHATDTQVATTRHVDLAIALDVSGSMDGLIESAKQRLWDITNELGRAEPRPHLRVAVLSYGNPDYGRRSGYVRVDQPFTRDLDAVNQTLFAFGTNGGDEYVARAVHVSVNQLQWSNQPDALRIIFIAGNESAEQDPQIRIEQAIELATDKDIFVNTIYCGNDPVDTTAGWQKLASLTHGMYATIDQNAAAVANIATPMDDKLVNLNAALNQTYVAFGQNGASYQANQEAQDENAQMMSAVASASRTVTKASILYNSSHWDLVDAVREGQKLEELDEEELPEEMRSMSDDERNDYIKRQTEQRSDLQRRYRQARQRTPSLYRCETKRHANGFGKRPGPGDSGSAPRTGGEKRI